MTHLIPPITVNLQGARWTQVRTEVRAAIFLTRFLRRLGVGVRYASSLNIGKVDVNLSDIALFGLIGSTNLEEEFGSLLCARGVTVH